MGDWESVGGGVILSQMADLVYICDIQIRATEILLVCLLRTLVSYYTSFDKIVSEIAAMENIKQISAKLM